jgi:hypothetical protein
MALATLVSAMDGQHGTIVHAAAPQIGKAVQQAGSPGAFGGIGNSKLRHQYLSTFHLDSTTTKASTILKRRSGMNKYRILLSAVIIVAMAAAAFAADVTGTWTASFDTQVGMQKYTYTFKVAGNKLTGKARSELANTESEIVEGTVNGDDISFVENLNFQDMPLRIVYKGKLMGDDLKLTRTILDMITEEAVAHRVK